jgi:hypothetical protein
MNYKDRNYNILGSGSFGMAFKPALPNIEDDHIVNYPNNVTKIFFNKTNLNKVMNATKNIENLMGKNKGHRMYKYRHKYTVRNLPYKVARKLRKLSKRKTVKKTNRVHLMRMPYLGIDIEKISNLENNIYKEIRKINFEIILRQIQKLIHQTANLAKEKYGHFDIRTPNIVVHPKSGSITIIDFDWLKGIDFFFVNFFFDKYF